jgi:hypothetical protein
MLNFVGGFSRCISPLDSCRIGIRSCGVIDDRAPWSPYLYIRALAYMTELVACEQFHSFGHGSTNLGFL